METERAVGALLAAVGSRDPRLIGAVLAPSASWQNVPHRPTIGREAIVRLLGAIVTWSDAVGWDVVSASFRDDTAWVERIDRFVIAGREHAVRCNGVFEVVDGRIAGVRDYVDLGEWRDRIAPALAAMSNRSAEAVVRRHLDGVLAGDPVRMAADYAPDAVLSRPSGEHRGWISIFDYFDTVPHRLGPGELSFDPIAPAGNGRVTVRWTITRSDATMSGNDTYSVVDGRIRHQTVEVDDGDF